jgi:hypothetical protein
MAAASSAAGGPQQLFADLQVKFNAFKAQNDAVDIAVTTLASAAQGVFIGECPKQHKENHVCIF